MPSGTTVSTKGSASSSSTERASEEPAAASTAPPSDQGSSFPRFMRNTDEPGLGGGLFKSISSCDRDWFPSRPQPVLSGPIHACPSLSVHTLPCMFWFRPALITTLLVISRSSRPVWAQASARKGFLVGSCAVQWRYTPLPIAATAYLHIVRVEQPARVPDREVHFNIYDPHDILLFKSPNDPSSTTIPSCTSACLPSGHRQTLKPAV